MKTCFILETTGEETRTVYRSLKRLMGDIGRPRQYQTFRRALKQSDKITVGGITIRNGALITSTHT